MKRIALFFILMFLLAYAAKSQTVDSLWNGYLSPFVQTGGTAPNFNVQGQFVSNGGFTGSQIELSKKPRLIVYSSNKCYELPFTALSGTGSIIAGTVIDRSGQLSAIPSGSAIIYQPSNVYRVGPFPTGVSASLQGCLQTYNNLKIDSIQVSGGSGITLGDKQDIDVVSTNVWVIDTNAVTTIKIAASAVDSSKIAANAVRTSDIGDAQITMPKIAQSNATSGQVIKWNGSAWAPAADNNTTYTAGSGISITGNTIQNDGVTSINGEVGDLTDFVRTTDPIEGDVQGNLTNTVVTAFQGFDVDMGTPPTTGQVLKWDGTAWTPAADATGGGGVVEPLNQLVIGTGTGVTSNSKLLYQNDTLKLINNRLKIKSSLQDDKIIIDNQKPFAYTSGTVTASDKILTILPPVNRSIANADTTPSFYFWNDYTKFHPGQTGDNVVGFGLNLSNGNQKAVSNFPAVGISMENWFQPNLGGEGLTEFITHFSPKTGSIYRPFSWYGNNNTGVMDIQFKTDRMSITNRATNKEVFNLTGGQYIFRGEDATGSGATPRIFFEDQRNTAKRGSITSDTAYTNIAGSSKLSIGCNDVSGWIQFTQRIADTRFVFGRTNAKNRVFFETEDDSQGYYKSGGAILLGGYCSLSKVANNAYGAVGSNYYLDVSGVLKRASSDVSSGWNFENGGARFWSSATGPADGNITLTHKASFDANGNLSLATTANPSYTLDAGGSNAAIRIPTGTTAQAPTGAVGVIRHNSTTGQFTGVRSGTTYENFLMSSVSGSVSTLLREESFTATAAQTAFTIAYNAPAVSGTSVPVRVYRNGVRLFYVASGPTITQFTYSGTTVTTAANAAGDVITVEYLN